MTPEQLERLKERRDEIITVAMGRCWHDEYNIYEYRGFGYEYNQCPICGKMWSINDPIPNPDYSTPEGWFELYNWLTKEKPDDFEDFYNWFWYDFDIGEQEHYIVHFVDNLPDLFVQWLVDTTQWEDESPLGKLMKEVLEC